jgi:Cu/Ag efflux protein CusF
MAARPRAPTARHPVAHRHPTASPAPAATAAVGHKAEGTVDGVDLKAGTLSLNHGPVPTLKWPAMTMEFKAANASLLTGLKPGRGWASSSSSASQANTW